MVARNDVRAISGSLSDRVWPIQPDLAGNESPFFAIRTEYCVDLELGHDGVANRPAKLIGCPAESAIALHGFFD
jgi:hypothetical protein